MPAEAIQYLSEALKLRRQVFPKLSTEVLSVAHNLAQAFVLTDTNMATALELFQSCLKGCASPGSSTSGAAEDSGDTSYFPKTLDQVLPFAEIQSSIASCLLSLGRSSDALHVLQAVLKGLRSKREGGRGSGDIQSVVEALIEVEFQIGCVVSISLPGAEAAVKLTHPFSPISLPTKAIRTCKCTVRGWPLESMHGKRFHERQHKTESMLRLTTTRKRYRHTQRRWSTRTRLGLCPCWQPSLASSSEMQ